MTVFTRLRALLAAGVVLSLAGALAPAESAPPSEGAVTQVVVDPQRNPAGSLAAYARLMALPSLDTGARPVSKAPRETGADDCPRDRCRDRRVPVPKGLNVPNNTVRVVLPNGYGLPRNADRRYPVLLLLNGGKSGYDGWTWKSELLEVSKDWPMILVMPAGGKGSRAGMFSDWADGTFQWETYHTRVVLPWVDRNYRTIKGARGVVGASLGALGALNYAARHPKKFKAVLSLSGLTDTSSLLTQYLAPDVTGPILGPILGVSGPDLRRVWGNPLTDRTSWDRHNPTYMAERLKGKTILLSSGTGFTTGRSGVYSGDFERNLWNSHRTFLLALQRAGVRYQARVAIGGIHNWPYFNRPLRWAGPKLIRALTR